MVDPHPGGPAGGEWEWFALERKSGGGLVSPPPIFQNFSFRPICMSRKAISEVIWPKVESMFMFGSVKLAWLKTLNASAEYCKLILSLILNVLRNPQSKSR